jgi:peptidoglycan/xylan/chitin deacetylase (PgdA/CDA1 family)
VVGDVYPRDPHRPGTEKIVRRVLDRATKGSIIILHDGGNTEKVDRSQTQAALNEIIVGLRDKGFEFVTLSTLIQHHKEY